MLNPELLEKFLKRSPACVMVRAALEKMFSPQALDRLFEQNAENQYCRELLFSTLVQVMSLVVCKTYRSVHAAYKGQKELITVSVKSLYNKLNGIEPQVCRALVQHSAQQAAEIMQHWRPRKPLLEGYRVKVIDGNHLSGTEHRLGVLREEGAAALPGVAVAVLDPDRGVIEDVIVAEDAYTQELKLCEPILERVEAKDVVIADRHYCTSDILFGLAKRGASFIIRQHMGRLRWELRGERREQGRTDTGTVYEQELVLTHPETGETLTVRRITIKLDKPTRDGDEELHILTNLPEEAASAAIVGELYGKRWTVETAFQQVTTSLSCELTTLGYPSAALFSFCMAVACYNVIAVIMASLGDAHGHEHVQENVSFYYLAEELSGTYRGMMIAIPPLDWECFQTMTAADLAHQLSQWAKQTDLSLYQKHRRKPKKKTKRPYSGNKHISTARLLNKRKPPS